MIKIFGREPVAWVALIEAFVAFLAAVVLPLSQVQVGLLMAVVVAAFGVYTAWVTHDTVLGYVVGFIKAVLALFLGFGVTLLSPEQAGALIALVSVAFGFYQRTQTFPSYDPPAPIPGSVAVSDVGTA